MSDRTSKHSKHSKHSHRSKHSRRVNISIDELFPLEHNKSGTRGRNLDIDTIFCNTPLNNEPEITFTSDILLDRIKKRRKEILNYYRQMLKYCHKRIESADEDQETDLVFTVIDCIPECSSYDPRNCLEYISLKLREDDFDTHILTDTTMFITWKYLELKKSNKKELHKLKELEKKRQDVGPEKQMSDQHNNDGNVGSVGVNNVSNSH